VWLLTVLVHTAAGGELPPVAWLVALSGLVAVSTAWVLRGSAPMWLTLPFLLLSQVGLHAALGATPTAGHRHAPIHDHPSTLVTSSVDDVSVRMLVAHLLCALFTAAVWWLRRWVEDVALALGAAALVIVRPSGRNGVHSPSLVSTLVWLVADPGRAPPLVAAPA